jgi:2-keto-4-pentenoate hydratase/2-oxohepta-3-ene-1,7-dioic acid hydratase in catechol pathway
LKLVTYDRGGHRRLGAWLGEAVVDLPDLVGHPAFPTTLEQLVKRNGGTVLEATRAVLERPELVEECLVPGAKLLPPLLPGSIRVVESFDDHAKAAAERRGQPLPDGWTDAPRYSKRDHRAIVGPDDDLPMPTFASEVDYEVGVAAVVGRGGRGFDLAGARHSILGFVLVNDWVARGAEAEELAAGLGPGRSRDFATSLGPWVVTADELDPRMVTLSADVDDERWSEGSLRDARWTFAEAIAHVSAAEDVLPGDVYASGTFLGGCAADLGRTLEPGATVTIEAEGLGRLSNRLVPA